MIELENRTSDTIDIDRLDAIAISLTDKDVELIITDDSDIQQINREYRKIDKPTDVLSFPMESMPMAPLGSIVISLDHVKKAAAHFNHAMDEELSLMFIHGLLHLLGYDHETDQGEMRRFEEELIERFDLPPSLIVRTEG